MRRLYSLENVCEIALASWLVDAGLRVDLIGRVLKQVRGMGGLSHLCTDDFANSKDVYLGIIRTPKGKRTSQQAVFIQSWAHLQNVFNQDSEASVLVIPLARRFELLALAMLQDK